MFAPARVLKAKCLSHRALRRAVPADRELAHNLQVPSDGSIEIMGGGGLACLLTDSPSAICVTGNRQNLSGQLREVTRREEHAGLPVNDDLSRGRNVARDQDSAACLGFEINEREGLGLRSHHDDVSEVEVVRHLRMLDPSGEAKAMAQAGRLTEGLHCWAPA